MSQDLEPQGNSGKEPRPLRASDAQRRRTVDLLSYAFSDGQITLAEFDERSALAFNAVFTADLEPLTADLSVPEDGTPVSYAAPSVEPGRGSTLSLSVFGNTERDHWLVPANHTSVAVFGSNCLDLRTAQLESAETTIECFATFGSVEVIVPPNVEVIVEGLGIFGSFSKKNIPQPTRPTHRVRITGLALFGGVEVKR